MIVLVAAVSFIDVVDEFGGGSGLFYLGAGVVPALVVEVVAQTAFFRFGSREHSVGSGP